MPRMMLSFKNTEMDARIYNFIESHSSRSAFIKDLLLSLYKDEIMEMDPTFDKEENKILEKSKRPKKAKVVEETETEKEKAIDVENTDNKDEEVIKDIKQSDTQDEVVPVNNQRILENQVQDLYDIEF